MNDDQLLDAGLEALDKLPEKVKKSTAAIRETDLKCSKVLSQIKVKVTAFAKSMKKMNKEQKAHHISEIEKLYAEAERLTKNKVTLAATLYDSVDKDIATMDKKTKLSERIDGLRKTVVEEETVEKGGRKKKKRTIEKEVEEELSVNVPVVEMPVDPNEPVYCLCHQVSFGEMVCCDNQECKTEWFHFQCIGMATSPPARVKWFCEACRANFKHVPNQWNYVTNEPPKKLVKYEGETYD